VKAVLAVLALCFWVSSPVYSQVVTVLPLGDSITQGVGGQPSYRRALWFMLFDAGYSVDFVGSHDIFGAAVPVELQDFDLDNEGHSAWEAGDLDAALETWLQLYDADIVLLHAGTNDLYNGQSIESTLDELGGIIDKLRVDNPFTIILLAKLIPGRTLDTAPFNLELETWVQGRSTPDSPIIVIDQAAGYDPFVENFDDLHPNEFGEEKMATRWLEGIQAVLTPGNQKPIVDAGPFHLIDSTSEIVTLMGSVSDDGLPVGSLTHQWSKIAGPGEVTFDDAAQLVTNVSFSEEGNYVLHLHASDTELVGGDYTFVQIGDVAAAAGHWPFYESSGITTHDVSVNANDGTLVNLDNSHWQPGVDNNSLCLDGLFGQQVSIPAASNGLQPASLTVAGWVKPDPAWPFWSWVAGQGDNYGLYVQGDKIVFYFYNGSTWNNVNYDNTAVGDGQWHHLAGSFDALTGSLSIYMDGVLLNATPYPESIVYSFGTEFSIGSMQGTRNFKGCLDEIRVYGRALTGSEIQVLAQVPGVDPVNQPPTVDAGVDQEIQFPFNTVRISAQINDDGLPEASTPGYTWTQQAGPGTALFTEIDFSGGLLTTDITLDLPGDYLFVLEVSDGELSGFDDVGVSLSFWTTESTDEEFGGLRKRELMQRARFKRR